MEVEELEFAASIAFLGIPNEAALPDLAFAPALENFISATVDHDFRLFIPLSTSSRTSSNRISAPANPLADRSFDDSIARALERPTTTSCRLFIA